MRERAIEAVRARQKGQRAGFLLAAACVVGLAASTSILASCSPSQAPQGEPEEVLLSAAPGLDARLGSFLADHPLPEGFVDRKATPSARSPRLNLAWCDSRQEEATYGFAFFRKKSPALVLERRWLAAAVNLEDPRWTVSETEARALGLEDLDSIELPRRALPVGGVFPGEEGWPFVEELRLVVDARDRRDRSALAAWLSAAAAATSATAAADRPLVLGAVGDIVAGPEEAALLLGGESGRAELFGGLLGPMRKADCLLGNLESPVAAGGSPNPRKRYRFLMPPGSLAALKDAGFDLLGFANNHVFDHGEEAFRTTLEEAKDQGLPLVGAGLDARAAVEPVRLAGKLSVIGFARYPDERWGFTTAEGAAGEAKPGVNADEEATREAIRRAKASGDSVIVLAHGGSEYRFEPAAGVKARYRSFIDAGATCVIASHPHVLQGAESYGGGLIAYSLGNFLFTGGDEPAMAQESAMLFAFLHRGRIRGLGLVPVFAGFTRSDLSRDPEATCRAFSGLCAALAADRATRP